jgi:hypothetical protein
VLGNNDYCSPTSFANLRWDVRTTKHGLALGKKLRLAQSWSQPWNKLRLAQAWPRPPAPCESYRRPLLQLFHAQPQVPKQTWPWHRKTFASPERCFGLDIIDKRTPNVIRRCRANVRYPTYYQELFTILTTAPTTTTRTASPSDRVRYESRLEGGE